MKLVLKIKRGNQNETLTLFILAASMAMGAMLDLLKVPALVKYSIDVVWMLLLCTHAINKFRMPNRESKQLLMIVLLFWVSTLVGLAINGVKIQYYLWGVRNNFRYYVFFFSVVMFVNESSIEKILDYFTKMHYINFVIILVQFFVLGLDGDHLGGFFGNTKGCNSKTIIFISIIYALSTLQYMRGFESRKNFILNCGMTIVIAVLAELKFFFLIAVMIAVSAMMITKRSMKNVGIMIISILVLYFGIIMLEKLFPQWRDIFTFENMFNEVSRVEGYTGRGDLNRLTAIPQIWKSFLTTWPKRLFGLGMGSCDTSAFSFLNTAFYEKYEYLRYNWFMSAFTFIENGIVGMIGYVSFFIGVYCVAHKREKSGDGKELWCQLAKIMSMTCVALVFYNASLRIEEGYMMYFVLALPLINAEKRTESCVESGALAARKKYIYS